MQSDSTPIEDRSRMSHLRHTCGPETDGQSCPSGSVLRWSVPEHVSAISVTYRFEGAAIGCRCLSATDGPGPGVGVITWGVRSRVMMVRLGRAGRRGKEYTGGRGFRAARPCASAGYARRPVAVARCWPGGSEVESVEANFWVILPCSPACRGTCSAQSAVALVRVTQPGASSRRSPSRDGSRQGNVMDKAGGIER
jgi:hypothetical protein